MMLLVNEPGTRRMFVINMRGPLYSVSYDGKTVRQYLDVNAPAWGVDVQSHGQRARRPELRVPSAVQSAGHAAATGSSTRYTDTSNMKPKADFVPLGATNNTHDIVLLEWTAKTPGAATYDGGAPRETDPLGASVREPQRRPSQLQPACDAGSPDFGLLYLGVRRRRQRRRSARPCAEPRVVVRQDPADRSAWQEQRQRQVRHSGRAIRSSVRETRARSARFTSYGVRNPQRFAWDSKTGKMFVAEIGQDVVEEVSVVTAGANLGWNEWEGSYSYVGRHRGRQHARDPKVIYPVVEYGHLDALLLPQVAITMGPVYRGTAIRQLSNKMLFGDNPSGEIFYVSADKLPKGGQDAIRRVLFNDKGTAKTLLQLIKEKNVAQGKMPAARADLRFGPGRERSGFRAEQAGRHDSPDRPVASLTLPAETDGIPEQPADRRARHDKRHQAWR